MKKILLVDDSKEIIQILLKWIKPLNNLEVIGTAGTEVSAINLFNELKPDILILDINLKRGSGINVLSEIKTTCPKVIVIMLTNYGMDVFRKVAVDHGADYFVDKTKDIDQLIDILTKLNS